MRTQTLLYSVAQALALTGAVISVSISPLVGKALAPSPEYTTLPYGVQFASVIFCSYLLSMAMKRYGRKWVFLLGSGCFALGGLLGAWSMANQSFAANIAAHGIFGVAAATFAYFRFAATDGLNAQQTAKAISLVTLGGIAAAFIGPVVAKESRLLFSEHAFSGSYLAFVILGLLLALVVVLVPAVKKVDPAQAEAIPEGQDKVDDKVHSKTKEPLPMELPVAIYAAGFGYMLMALLMMQSSLKMSAMGVAFDDIMLVIQCHVVAMFLPSLFMGRVIAWLGVGKVIMAGYLAMFIAMLIAILDQSYGGILTALIGIGLGWNMLYVGGSSLVASIPGDAHKLQGINESAVALLNTLGAFSAGFLFQSIGWENSNWLSMVLLLPGLILLLRAYKKGSAKL